MSVMKLTCSSLERTLFFSPLQTRLNYISSDSSSLQPIQMAFSKYEASPKSEKPPVVIMHGLFGSKRNWSTVARGLMLKTNRNVICVDARNHGGSPHTSEFSYNHLVADMKFFFDENLKIYSAQIIGHSMGGRAMMLFALKYPEKVEKVVIVDISPHYNSRMLHRLKAYFEILKSVSFDDNLPLSKVRKSTDQQLSEGKVRDPNIRQFLLTNLIKKNNKYGWKMNLDTLSVKFNEIVTFPSLDSACNKPALFIAGTKSDYLRPEHESSIKKLFPSSEFVYLDCGHWVHAEKPTEFLAITSDFINRS